MNRKIIQLSVVSLMLLFVGDIYANDEKKTTLEVKDRPVDDAVKTVVKEDSIKGGEKKKDKQHQDNILLKELGKTYQINRKGLNYPPYRCYIYHADKSSSEIGIIDGSTISFTINKSQLVIGDTIVVTNNQDTGDKNYPKMPIEWIEIK